MSQVTEELWAVYLDYELDGKRNTVVLGGFGPDDREYMGRRLYAMRWGYAIDDAEDLAIWEVDEDDLPWGYKFQTYYVARYFTNEPMVGVA